MRTPGWLRTARRILPRLVRLSGKLRPTFQLPSVAALSPEFLREERVSGVIWDVDGTLMPHHAHGVSPELRETVDRLFREPGLRHAILSNCEGARLLELGRLFPNVPIIAGYETAHGDRFRVLTGESERWLASGVEPSRYEEIHRPQIDLLHSRPMRKPSAVLVEAALCALGLEARRERVLMVGDQHFTDVASANLAGIRSVKVPTLARGSFPIPVRLSQLAELGLYRILYRDGVDERS